MVKILRSLYRTFIKTLVEKRQRRHFMKHSHDVLGKFCDCMEKSGHFYTLAFGTLLGAVREGGFIKHDIDLDIYIWNEDYQDKIQQDLAVFGFKLKHTFLIQNGALGREETYVLNGVSIDIFYIYPPVDKLPYCCDFLGIGDSLTPAASMREHGGVQPRRIEMPFVKERMAIDFEGIRTYIPLNAHEVLKFRYGEDYMTPNPKWTIHGYDNHIIEWQGVKGQYVE